MKVVFVGMHNKPGMLPLDSKTRSGKLIDRIIEGIQTDALQCVKTNLYDSLTWPQKFEESDLIEWVYRNEVGLVRDIIVTLGDSVHQRFKKLITIKLGHPSAIWSNEKKDEYVAKAIEKIQLHIELVIHHERLKVKQQSVK